MMRPKCANGCGNTTHIILKGDPKRDIKAGEYRKYCSHRCYLEHRRKTKVQECRRGHPYIVTLGGRNKCRVCSAAKRLARKTQRPWLEVLQEIGLPPARCPVCKRVDNESDWWHTLVPDHDHSTGHFRGWLCGACNKALGMVGDDPRILKRLSRWLVENGAIDT